MPAVPAFTVEEITTLQVALNAAMEEATKNGIDIPLDTMLEQTLRRRRERRTRSRKTQGGDASR